jgi:hypothetical protein
VVKSVSLPVLLSQRCTRSLYMARPTLELIGPASVSFVSRRPSEFVDASPCKVRLMLFVWKLEKFKEIDNEWGSSNKKKMKN